MIRKCDVCEDEFCNDCAGERWREDGTQYDGTICADCEIPPTDEELAQMEVMHRDYLDRYVRAMEESEEREESEGSEDLTYTPDPCVPAEDSEEESGESEDE